MTDDVVKTWVVQPVEAGSTLERFLSTRVPSEPIDNVRRAIATRVRRTGGDGVESRGPVRAGERIELLAEPLDEVIVDEPLPIIATADGWFAVDKPSGVPVHPVRSVRRNSVIERVRRQLGNPSLRLAHRLDRDTSGVLLIARDGRTASRLGRAFARAAVVKVYVAVVRGVPSSRRGTIDLPIGRAVDSEVRVRQAIRDGGRHACTDWTIEARGQDRARLLLFPKTGRRHQLRVHLEAIGHPILGDVLYGRPDRDYLDLVAHGIDRRREDGSPRRMLLHARRLQLDWPGLDFDVRSSVPDEFTLDDT